MTVDHSVTDDEEGISLCCDTHNCFSEGRFLLTMQTLTPPREISAYSVHPLFELFFQLWTGLISDTSDDSVLILDESGISLAGFRKSEANLETQDEVFSLVISFC